VFDGDQIKDLEAERKNRAKEIIEDFMIAANGVTARYLASKMYPSLRRVVRTPQRWDRIIALASEHAYTLTEKPDSNFGNLFEQCGDIGIIRPHCPYLLHQLAGAMTFLFKILQKMLPTTLLS
jgi:exoribonuclease R